MAKYRLSFDVDLVGLEVPTKPDVPAPSVTPMYIPTPVPNMEPGRYDQWSGYAPVPQAHALPQATYASWGGYAPVSPEQVGQYTPTPGYVTPPPMLQQSEPMLVPGKIDEQAEHALTYMRTYAAEMERLEAAGNAPDNVIKEAKQKAQLEYEKAKVKEEIEKLKAKVSKEK